MVCSAFEALSCLIKQFCDVMASPQNGLEQNIYDNLELVAWFLISVWHRDKAQYSYQPSSSISQMNRNPTLLPSITRESSCLESKMALALKPSLQRIRYPLLTDCRAKENRQSIMVQSCISNTMFDDIADKKREQNIAEEFDPSEEGSRKYLQAFPTYIGKEAPLKFYNQYKSLDRTLLRRDLSNITPSNDTKLESPTISLLEKADALKVLPLCLGLVKSKGEASILNISDYNLGDRYIMALAAGLKNSRNIEKMYMSGNRITDLALAELATSINAEVTVVELARNKITKLDKKLLEMIIDPQYRLEWLGLANNHLKEASADAIFRKARYSQHIVRLDLRHNKLGTGCLESLVEFIGNTSTLEELYLGGNYLSGRSGEKVFKALALNKSIRVFDYSLNQLGDDAGFFVAQAISYCFQTNKKLEHLDLSFNNFSKQSSEIISLGLQPNRTLLGFHFRGNYGYVNAKGFLVLSEREGTQLHSVDSFKIDGFSVSAPLLQNSLDSHNYRDACWICEGWYEQEFKLALQKTEQNMFVFVHFDFEKYEPRLISLSEHVKYTAMVPPRKYRFFYTVNKSIHIDPSIPKQKISFPETHTYEMNHEMVTFRVDTINFRSGKPKKIINEWGSIIIKTLPRCIGLTIKKEKEPWTFEKSVWAKEWKLDNEDTLRKCFERDWRCSKLPNLVKVQTDQDRVKDLLWNAYSQIKNLYKQFSSWNPFGDIWAVSSNPFTEFCQHSRIISKDTPLKIIDLTFITTNSMSSANYKGNTLVPERGLVRFQFMEALVRLADEKYKKLGLAENFADSIDQLLREHVLPLAEHYSMSKWRPDKYFTEFNDNLIKRFRPLFAALYKRNSKLKVRPGEKPYMCLAEFKGLLQRVGANASMTERDIFVAFNNAMMTQVDELDSERFMKMTEIQFIEGLARCACCLPSSCTLKETPSTPLHFKFQWLVQQLKSICPEEVRSQIPELQTSIFGQEQEED